MLIEDRITYRLMELEKLKVQLNGLKQGRDNLYAIGADDGVVKFGRLSKFEWEQEAAKDIKELKTKLLARITARIEELL